MKLIPKNNFLIFPNELLESAIKKLKSSELILLIVLWYLSQRFSTDEFYYSDQKIVERFGLSQASITRARKELKRLHLISYESGFKVRSHSRATRYKLLPTDRLRKRYRIRNQKDKLYKPP